MRAPPRQVATTNGAGSVSTSRILPRRDSTCNRLQSSSVMACLLGISAEAPIAAPHEHTTSSPGNWGSGGQKQRPLWSYAPADVRTLIFHAEPQLRDSGSPGLQWHARSQHQAHNDLPARLPIDYWICWRTHDMKSTMHERHRTDHQHHLPQSAEGAPFLAFSAPRSGKYCIARRSRGTAPTIAYFLRQFVNFSCCG